MEPMSDERLAEIRTAFERIPRLFERGTHAYAVYEAGVALLTDNERLRAREAALVEIVRAVALTRWTDDTPDWVAQARALLASSDDALARQADAPGRE